jgi:2-alkyl-3-oxoalkanoate reductase
MKLFIQGATGVLGRRLVRDFSARGHEVVGLARGEKGEKAVRAGGGTPAKADVFDASALAEAAKGAQVVVRAATAIPQSSRPKPAEFAETNKLRTEGAKALLAAASQIGAKVYLQESIVWVARPPDGSPFDESTPPQDSPVNGPVIEAERLAAAAGADGKLVTTTMRLGNFFAPDAWHTRFIGEQLLKHKLPIIGRGDGVLAIIHVDDASAAFVAAAERPRSGIFHLVDETPAPTGELLRAFASKLGAPEPSHVAPWLARLAAGKYTVEFFTVPMRTSNARVKEAFGWAPKFPTYKETLDDITAAWRKEGFAAGPPSEAPRISSPRPS